MKNILTMLLFCIATIISCNGKQNQVQAVTAANDAPEATVEEEPYNFKALAKAVEGSTYIDMLDCGALSVDKGDERFYIDLQGNILDSQPEEEVDPNALMARYNDGLFGYVDADKNLVIPYQYHFACDFSDGMGLVINDSHLVGYVNTKGELVIPYQYETPSESNGNDFHEGLCAVVVDGDYEWFSYIDKTGKLAFPGIFSQAGDFNEGLAAITTTGEEIQRGYIDHSGKMVITLPEGWWGRKFHDGVAQTLKYDSCFVIDKTGKRLFQVNRDIVYTGNDIIYSHGLAVVIGKGKYEHIWGLMDKRGRITFCLDEDD